MQFICIAGISPDVITYLKKGRSRTVEFVSAQNVVCASALSPSDPVYITPVCRKTISRPEIPASSSW